VFVSHFFSFFFFSSFFGRPSKVVILCCNFFIFASFRFLCVFLLFAEDVLNWIKNNMFDSAEKKALKKIIEARESGKIRVSYFPYDWSLIHRELSMKK